MEGFATFASMSWGAHLRQRRMAIPGGRIAGHGPGPWPRRFGDVRPFPECASRRSSGRWTSSCMRARAESPSVEPSPRRCQRGRPSSPRARAARPSSSTRATARSRSRWGTPTDSRARSVSSSPTLSAGAPRDGRAPDGPRPLLEGPAGQADPRCLRECRSADGVAAAFPGRARIVLSIPAGLT